MALVHPAWGVCASFIALTLGLCRLWLHGTWRGCVISAAWCIGEGALAPPEGDRLRPALVAGVSAISVLNMLALPRSCATVRARVWLGLTVGAQLAVIVAALVPMSCGALDTTNSRWIYAGWNDVGHDAALFVTLALAALARMIAPAAPRGLALQLPSPLTVRARPVVTWMANVCAPLAVYGIFQCPTASERLRPVLLALELGALLGAQLAHVVVVIDIRVEAAMPKRSR